MTNSEPLTLRVGTNEETYATKYIHNGKCTQTHSQVLCSIQLGYNYRFIDSVINMCGGPPLVFLLSYYKKLMGVVPTW